MSDENGVHIIIQARMGSTRLPGKILIPFTGGRTFLEWIVERAHMSHCAEKVIVATTTNTADDETEALCIKRGFDYLRGSEEDVLGRYVAAAQKFGSRIIVRITSDNPLTDIPEMDRLVEMLEAEKFDYATNHTAGLPTGSGSEAFTATAFMRVSADAKDPYEHEHVTPYFYRHPELFKQCQVPPREVHPFAPAARLTLDTAEDAAFLKELAGSMRISDPASQPSTNEILSFLESHPELVAINQTVIQKTFHTS